MIQVCQYQTLHDRLMIFEQIVGYKKTHDGNSPSIRDLCNLCHVSSTSVMSYALRKLERAGLIRLAGEGKTRSIHVVGGQWTFSRDSSPRCEAQDLRWQPAAKKP